ncbi:phosphoglycerate mutase, 2,3-bisphosphoglycerate-independent [Syntrophotalea carbinolica DSM 2380]|uniref:Phosphoglycerate mutase, 2,3-bisphosphoglycerate-independent n=1 Tax=Syntrophotalea carbinolica (strain DSM 2380 / NBRC 103641 / GraBd1) TaxID=338963 RepID=Q3A6C6_SYNC1|nr:alkaline phosphatase family protein [Syntrophotalea carbinolica]ABA88081.1 phosphoglycerate mutase, 2,3-bisphosphoglycerate-independent [Syntrophotalea carbinolica DSM 2380]
MRCILLLLDGLGDRSHSCLDGRTPLQAAHTPNLDRLASLGMNGLFHAHLQGTALPSELAHFLMFGYRMEDFPGRGVVEALGEGLDIRENDVALLARIFSVEKRRQALVLRHENPALDRQDCQILQGAVRNFSRSGIDAVFLPTGGIGGILRLRGKVSKGVTDSNPIIEGRPLMEVFPLRAMADDACAQNTARFLNDYLRWSYRTLSEHPLNRQRIREGLAAVNAVGTQRAGMLHSLPSFADKWGLKGLLIASGAVYHGIGQVLGMDTRGVRDTGDPGRDLQARLAMACQAREFDFVHVHTKIADQAGHTKNPLLKKRVIESIDTAIAYVLEEIVPDDDILFVVTADHSTASSGRMIHSGETVPLVMVGQYVRRDDVETFDEVSCASGGLSLVRGTELMYLILNFLDRGKLWGLRDAPDERPFASGISTPLRID